MSTVLVPAKTRKRNALILSDVPWKQYVQLLRILDEQHVRLTFDRGVLEIMTLSHEHESEGYIVCRFVDTLTEVLAMPVKGGRSTTFKRRKKLKGLEPDGCWWIKNEARVRGKKKIDLRIDPAPDLALEIDISHSSLDRMKIYAALGVTEVWRYDGTTLLFYLLQDNAKYTVAAESLSFPALKPSDLLPFIAMHAEMDETSVVRQFRAWVEKEFKARQ